MERIRPFLMITLIFLGLLLWQAWEDKHSPQVKLETVEQSNHTSVPRPILHGMMIAL